MTIAPLLAGALFFMTTASPTPRPVPMEAGHWQWNATEGRIEDHLGRKSLYLKGGIATVNDVRLTSGVIEFDIAFTGERGFMGGIWRVQDPKNFEEFYVRPHQSGNPDANQYTPVFHGVAGWQLYHGPLYSVPVTYRFNEWTHVKIVFAGAQAEIYYGAMEKPVLFVDELKRAVAPGGVGVSALKGFAPAWFSNFSYTATDSPAFRGSAPPPAKVPENLVPSWQVSDVFRESALDGKHSLGPEDLADRTWTRLDTERSGLANLARLQPATLVTNTVFARKVLHSSREQIKRLDFGFSNKVRFYLNGRLLFRGDDAARSRDYRFLGSIGFFDALYLPLREGENEILLAVTVNDDLGGWGVQARLEDFAGIILKD